MNESMNTDEYINLFDDLDDRDQTENFINKNKRPQRFPERLADDEWVQRDRKHERVFA